MHVRLVAAVIVVSMQVAAVESAGAQDTLNRPVRIVTTSAGSGTDFSTRLIAQGISGPLGQPVIVDNRGSGVIPGQVAARASPDGHTVVISGPGLWLGQFMRDQVPYDFEKDFAPVSIIDRASLLLVVHPSLPVSSVNDLVAHAKAKPGALSFSTGSTGSSSHLTAELFKYMTGANMVRVPYKSSAQEIGDLLANQVQLTFTANPIAIQNGKSGKLRILAHTGDQPSALYPGLPMVAAAVPGYRAVSITAMFVPARTPAAAINRLNEVTVRFLHTPEAKERLLSNGVEAVGSSPEELGALLKVETAQWGKVIKAAGIKSD